MAAKFVENFIFLRGIGERNDVQNLILSFIYHNIRYVVGKDKMARKSKASSPIRPAPCVDFTKIKPLFQSFQQNDTQGTIDG